MAGRRGRLAPAFTLLELLVIVAMVVVLLALLLPALQSARRKARQAQCLSQLRQLYLGNAQHAADKNGYSVPMSPGAADLGPCNTPRGGLPNLYRYRHPSNYLPPTNTEYFPPGESDQNTAWMGLGFLWYWKYINDGRLFWCPANTHPTANYNDPNEGWSNGQPWTRPNFGTYYWMSGVYVQRASLQYGEPGYPTGRQVLLGRDPSGTAFIADQWCNDGLNGAPNIAYWHHRDGYCVIYLDGTAVFKSDPRQTVAADVAGMPGGGVTKFHEEIEEPVWRTQFDR